MENILSGKGYERCKELGVFKMKCLKNSDEETMKDLCINFINIMYEDDPDNIHPLIKKICEMPDEQFEFEKKWIEFKVKMFDRHHRPRSIDPFEHLKLY